MSRMSTPWRAITTAAQAEEELETQISKIKVYKSEVDELIESAAEDICAIENPNITLDKVAEGPKSNPWGSQTWQDRYFARTLQQYPGIVREDGTWKVSARGVEGVMSSLKPAMAGGNREVSAWLDDDQVEANGITVEDAARFRSMFQTMAELNAAITGLRSVQADYRKASAEYGQFIKRDTRAGIGTLVYIQTSRRNVLGMVVGGRGKTIHVRPVPSRVVIQQSVLRTSPETSLSVVDPWHIWLQLGTLLDGEESDKPERFTLGEGSSATVEVILDRHNAIKSARYDTALRKAYAEAKTEGEAAFAPMTEWLRIGGREAEERKQRLTTVLGQLDRTEQLDMLMSARRTGTTFDQYLFRTLAGMGSVAFEEWRQKVRDTAVADLGGPITAIEQARIDAKPPEDIATMDLNDLQFRKFAEKFGRITVERPY